MSVSDYGLERQLMRRLEAKLPGYRFYELDLTPHKVVSLHQTLQQLLPPEVLESPAITYCVHVLGLENSRLASEDGQIVDSGLIAQLNFEREIVFRKPNYLTLLWGDHDFFVQLQRQAPDFWSWVTYFFEFKQEEAYTEVPLPEVPAPDVPARLPAREEYIQHLEAKLQQLPLNAPDKSRTTRERLNLYSLLADEYAKYFDYEKAQKYYEYAINLYEQLGETGTKLNKLLFDYASLNLKFRSYTNALGIYQSVLSNMIAQKDLYNIGGAYYQIGRVYQEQQVWDTAIKSYQKALEWYQKLRQYEWLGSIYHEIGIIYEDLRDWNQALENYQKALEWNWRIKQEHRIGGTYHQIGILYEKQGQWDQALDNYQQALKWNQKTKQEHLLGGTYHQIGMLYEKQQQWEKALENYRQALKLNQQTGQEWKLGSTYHGVGMVYSSQQKWNQAFESYQLALGWYRKTAQEHELGSTYHQIGILYETQQQWEKALESYSKALEWNRQTGQEHQIVGTYHQIGMVYEKQHNLVKAEEYYQKAAEALPPYFEDERAIVAESLARLRERAGAEG
ncbi:tetratricopeptide (TPR) repeat protein [Rhabdobacter roseus]|uniref:Tetratricopeptide (TPR) repeat protein n=1 Tax=Rhabdobacter roseus TaxID=1655419 RepID=A0A840TPR5_9BACT|nr:tetratricopeptide repeat protein [Rhabdobacter roseus]MBB5282040.1 tetratricopeptide (TPR) repeat protein [Rhabdobacter roseus]